MKNYLEKLDENINLFYLGNLLEKLHKKHGIKIRKIFNETTNRSLYYYWKSNKAPIKIKYLKMLKVYNPKILDEAFQKVIYFSAGNKKVILPKKITPKLAYLIGVIHGDGHINKNKKNIAISEENKEYHEKVLKEYFKELFEVKTNVSKIKNKNNHLSAITSKVIVSFLSQFCPIGRKKGRLNIPKEIKKDKQLITEYLSGLFDTDGCLTHMEKERKSIYFVFVQSDKKFLFEVFCELKKLGIDVNIPRMWMSPIKPYDKERKLKEWKIYIGSKKTLGKFLKLINFKHPMKKLRSEMMMKKLGLVV